MTPYLVMTETNSDKASYEELYTAIKKMLSQNVKKKNQQQHRHNAKQTYGE